jgi:hypothetical protein
MAMTVRVAYFAQVVVNQVGAVVDRDAPTTTLKDVLTSSSEYRIAPDTTNPSTNTPTPYPTLVDYLTREAAAGYKASFVSPAMVITYLG